MSNFFNGGIDRREFLVLGVGACCALGLAACGQADSRGGYDDGYAAGYAAGVADTEAKAKQEEEEKAASMPESGVEYTINSASIGARSYSGEPVLVLEVTGKNVSDGDESIYFNGDRLSVYQDGKGLSMCPSVEGRDYSQSRSVQAGVTLDGWVAYELIDTTTPVEIKAGSIGTHTNYYGLTNPQTIDLSTL